MNIVYTLEIWHNVGLEGGYWECIGFQTDHRLAEVWRIENVHKRRVQEIYHV